MRIALVIVVTMLSAGSVLAQTGADLEAKFGKPNEVYSVSEHIWMTPFFAPNGEVCQLRLFPRRTDGSTNYLTKALPFDELVTVLNSLVPVDQRGARKQSFGITATGGPAAWTTYGYEKVTFIFTSAFPSLGFDNSPPLKKGDYVFPSDGSQPNQQTESRAASKDDFRESRSSTTDIVTIWWSGRKCGSDK